ncbi:Putative transposase [Roseovarius gaetbuli]|uniref:Putative transposase n=1 Tax=Roseovarius gaetbuli TaxID=1356575 RepID=A0A1X6YIJ5_9RHOB|nr:Putative transposase [Roseovarius gaetbuli]
MICCRWQYSHLVFTFPGEIAKIAYWNKKVIYGLLFRASAETVTTIAADPKCLGARVGMTSVLHTWGSAMTHHPPVHMIVPGGGPEAVLAYLSRYTHRIAISNSRIISADAQTVACQWKDYRVKSGDRMKVMRLNTGEFIRRFLIHVLPDGFHRIRHYGLLTSATPLGTRAAGCCGTAMRVLFPCPVL